MAVPVSWCLSLEAEAAALLGQADAARAAADEARGRAWVEAAEGRTSLAIAHLLAAAERARARGQAVFELLALHDALRMGEHGVAERVKARAAEIDGAWAAAIGQHATAQAQGDAAGLETAATSFVAIGSML